MEAFVSSGEPPQVGQSVVLSIHDVGFGGEGVGRHGSFVVFVPGTIPGESVEAEVTEVKKQFARARLKAIVQPSPDRAQPRCEYYGLCGGCQYQHVSYPRQLEIKRKQVRDLLQRIGGFSGDVVAPVLACSEPYGYRNRIMVRSQWNKPEQRLNIGFLEAESRLVVDVERCAIAEPTLNEQLALTRRNPPPKGGIKVMLRVAPEGWSVGRDSFFQNNFFALPHLVRAVREIALDAGSRFLIDAYCGVGFFALELADLMERYAGVELDAAAIRSARENAIRRGRPNGEFIQGRAEEKFGELTALFPPDRTTVVLDPPRTGCAPEIIALLRELRPRQVIYVSCHPATLARDLNAFCAEGVFGLRQVIPIDMFPQTQHVECVADIRSSRALPPCQA
ncbi:MAG: class I SAM-dependent RNA methyltransferase [Verrucomicrobia bacterium]|nr:class I SAM-dependent RNA methyltransferase [Verrucomicrobiota bacterium]